MNAIDYRQLAEHKYWYAEGVRAMRIKCYSVACSAAAVAFALGAIFF